MKNKPGQPCKTCRHLKVRELEKAILSKQETIISVARRTGLHEDSLKRHLANHVTEERKKEILLEAKRERVAAIDAEINADVDDISSGLKFIVREVTGILQRAKAAGDDNLALVSLRDMRQTFMDLAKIYGQLSSSTTININVSELPQWVQLRHILVEVFRCHPEAGEEFMSKTRHMHLVEHRQELLPPP